MQTEECQLILTQFCSSQFTIQEIFFLIAIVNVIDILRFFLIVISWWSCIVVYGDCSCGNSCIGGGGLQFGGQISSLIIMSSLLSSNVGDGGGDWSCLCSAFSPCSKTFSNTIGMAVISKYNKIRNYYWIDTVFSLSIYLISIFKFQ